MSYIKQEFKSGDKLYASELNLMDEQIYNNTEAISGLREEIVNLNGGTPTTVSLVSEMVDTTKIYLYVGTEDGYTKGDWYYHNGTSWVRGGKYGGSASGTGWTSEQITLLETIGEYLVFTDASTGQAMFDSLIASLRKGASSGGGTTEPDNPETPDNPDTPDNPTAYTITNSLVNVTTDNNSTSVEANGSYTANLTPNSNHYIDSVTVTMGGVNVTNTVYADGVITIPEVTGNVVIVASGAESDNLIVLSECTDGESMPNGAQVTKGTFLVTPYFEIDNTATYYTNLTKFLSDGTQTWSQKLYLYDENKTATANAITMIDLASNSPYGSMVTWDMSTRKLPTEKPIKYGRVMFHVLNDNPYFGLSGKVV